MLLSSYIKFINKKDKRSGLGDGYKPPGLFYGVNVMTKKDVIQLLEKIAIYMELNGENTFKVSAYRKAAQSLEIDERSLDEIKDVTELKGIGKG